jgi:Protein of unknown function (DUF3073)
MGRGRAKAKQTKVARELKYHSPETDLEALQRELSGNGQSNGKKSANDDDDPYAAYLDETDEDDEAADGARSSKR